MKEHARQTETAIVYYLQLLQEANFGEGKRKVRKTDVGVGGRCHRRWWWVCCRGDREGRGGSGWQGKVIPGKLSIRGTVGSREKDTDVRGERTGVRYSRSPAKFFQSIHLLSGYQTP